MDIELDEDMMGIDLEATETGSSASDQHKAKALRQTLAQELRDPLSDGVRKSKLVVASKHKGMITYNAIPCQPKSNLVVASKTQLTGGSVQNTTV